MRPLKGFHLNSECALYIKIIRINIEQFRNISYLEEKKNYVRNKLYSPPSLPPSILLYSW